jgi:hypothetical protein
MEIIIGKYYRVKLLTNPFVESESECSASVIVRCLRHSNVFDNNIFDNSYTCIVLIDNYNFKKGNFWDINLYSNNVEELCIREVRKLKIDSLYESR